MNKNFYNWLEQQKYDWNEFNKLWMLKRVYDYYRHHPNPSPYNTLMKSWGWEGYDWENVLSRCIGRSLIAHI